MQARLALIGGEEFSDGFENVHATFIELVNNLHHHVTHPISIAFLPTCAADDGLEIVRDWCETARNQLESLGAKVLTPMVIDRESANDINNAEQVANADWVYLGGGYPQVGMRILGGTLTHQAIMHAYNSAALISGASAGAMLLCSQAWVISGEFDTTARNILANKLDPEKVEFPVPDLMAGLNLVPNSICWPHLNQFFSKKLALSGAVPMNTTMLGIDEQTAIFLNSGECWQVLGKGKVMVMDQNKNFTTYIDGEQFPFLKSSIVD